MNHLPGVSREEQWSQMALEGGAVGPSCRLHSRDRVSVDLRDIGRRFHACRADRNMTASALVRAAVVAFLGSKEDELAKDTAEPVDAGVAKLTLRMGGRHAALLSKRAGAAAVSRGAYIATLLDAMPPGPRSPDHREAVAALAHSTQKLAAMSRDLNVCIRLARPKGTLNVDPASSLMQLSQEVRLHLQMASRLVAELAVPPRGGQRHRVVSNGKVISQ
jgi:hypothetical protein